MKTMFALCRQYRLRVCGAAASTLLAASSLLGAQNVAPRITEPVDDAARVSLKGSVSAAVRAATDLGEVPASTQMTHVRLGLKRSEAQQAALEQYLAELQQKSSPNYHKWLTPEQFGAMYGPADSDIAAIVAWLESQGLTVEPISKGKTDVAFSGTAGQIAKAFGTSIHSFRLGDREFMSNTTEPRIPAALAGVVSGVTHLSTLAPRPMSHRGTPATLNINTGRFTPMSDAAGAGPHPELSFSGSSSGSQYLYVVPADAATIYNAPNSFNGTFTGSQSYTGAGVTIGIGGDANVSTTPVVNYRKAFLGNSTAPTITYTDTVNSTNDASEAYLDMEISGGMAPSAKIHYYASQNLYDAISQALNDNTVDIFSLSFGLCELYYTTSDNQTINSWWSQAAAQGIAVTVSSGDNGSAGCDPTSDSSGNSITAAKVGLQVNGLASTPYNIAVGGTDYKALHDNFSLYATPPGSTGVSGSASTFFRTALKYIPETTWNDSTSNNTTISANVPWTKVTDQNIVAGSGGKSTCSTNTTVSTTSTFTPGTCTSGYAKPSWQQTGTSNDSDGARDLPDVSLLSGNGLYSAVWTVCDTYVPSGSTQALNCSDMSGAYNVDGFGGTSAAAPAFAGMLALVQESQGGGRLGQAAENLYNLNKNSANASKIFHDVTVGNISVPCTAGTPNCGSNGFLKGFDTATGYDLATGLGSVDVSALIANWANSTGTATATVTVTPASSTVNVANTLDVKVVVSGGSGGPTGSVTLKSGTYTSAITNLNSGSATITIPGNKLAVGVDTLTATYGGDGIYASASGTAMVTVDSATLTPTTTTLTVDNASPTQGTNITLTATLAPSAATGTVTFNDGTTKLGTGTLASGKATFQTSSLSVGAHAITAVYGGDTSYASSTSTAVTVTVAAPIKGSFTLALSPSSLTVSRGSSGNETMTLTPANGYKGTVQFSVTTSDNNALANLCVFGGTGFDTNGNLQVTGSSAVSATVQIDTNASDCVSAGAIRTTGPHGMRLLPRGGSAHASNQKSSGSIPGGLAFAGLLLAGLLGRSSRKLRGLACVIALTAIAFGLSACGSTSGGGSSGVSNPPKGTYTITLIGEDVTDTSITAQGSFTLVIK
ncbi:protease pro-enzyme activation domain-containing protein [Occallatibacter riparius]|uniref:Protease pro-enzyme activation domain-containing protein n=1 Tax=Occallatibacter riparius TaxID=1002689 RepID=A0A9J7BUJ0_9BACT|nr:protease pro-enzyme activation domain-containing protein [Occallatibacter riparius]UWZ84669.1 protease pro-enzyme activation domain-containing protein [Occallatibacter riparius]